MIGLVFVLSCFFVFVVGMYVYAPHTHDCPNCECDPCCEDCKGLA